MTVQYIVCKGIPASGKSSWATAWVAEDPLARVRVNKDILRAMTNGSQWSKDYEKVITDAQRSIIEHALRAGKSVVNDNTNFSNLTWSGACKLVRELNIDCTLTEKPFFVELNEAIARDAMREGTAKVGEAVIRKFWKSSGGESFKGYLPKTEIFVARPKCEPPKYDASLDDCVICDLDGSLALIGNRSPYDAKDCDLIDSPNQHVVEIVQAMFDFYGYIPIFCSGREDKHEPETRRFIEKHMDVLGWDGDRETKWYKLLMRKTGDQRSDDIIKEEIYREHIEGKYNVKAIIDDRLKVCRMWHRLELPLLRVGDPDAVF